MVSAVVLISCERNQIIRVAEQLAEIDGISEVFSVAGRYDLVAILRVRDNEALAELAAQLARRQFGPQPVDLPRPEGACAHADDARVADRQLVERPTDDQGLWPGLDVAHQRQQEGGHEQEAGQDGAGGPGHGRHPPTPGKDPKLAVDGQGVGQESPQAVGAFVENQGVRRGSVHLQKAAAGETYPVGTEIGEIVA